jgi:hypothetical protein
VIPENGERVLLLAVIREATFVFLPVPLVEHLLKNWEKLWAA